MTCEDCDHLSAFGGAVQVLRLIAKSARDIDLADALCGRKYAFSDGGHAVCVGAAKGFLAANDIALDPPAVKPPELGLDAMVYVAISKEGHKVGIDQRQMDEIHAYVEAQRRHSGL